MVAQTDPARSRRVLIAAASAVGAVGLLFSFGGSDARTGAADAATATQAATDPRTLVIGVSSDPQTLDPEFGQATRANETLKNIYAQWVHYPPLDPNKDITSAQ